MITMNTLNSVYRRMQILSANFKVLFQQVFNCCAGSSSFRFHTNTWFSLDWFFWCVTRAHSEPIFLFLGVFPEPYLREDPTIDSISAPSPGNSGPTSPLDFFQVTLVQMRSKLSTQVHHDHYNTLENIPSPIQVSYCFHDLCRYGLWLLLLYGWLL